MFNGSPLKMSATKQWRGATMHDYGDYGSRHAYLVSLADDSGIELETVLMLADLLGPDEDFDLLVTALEDGGGYD